MRSSIDEKAINLSNKQRKHWRQKYGISERELYQLFAEFTALMMVARERSVETDPGSMQSRFKKTFEGKDYLAELLPFSSGCLKTYGKNKKAQDDLKSHLTEAEVTDYRVPVEVFTENSQILMRTKPLIRPKLLQAVGVDVQNKNARVDWECFLLLN